LLMPNLDKVFDLGFITFASDGVIVISDELENAPMLGVEPDMGIKIGDNHQAYMTCHRENVFVKHKVAYD